MSYLLIITSLTALVPQSADEAKATLETHNVKVVGSNLVVDGEKELSTQLKTSPRKVKTVMDAWKAYANAERARAELERNISLLTQQHGQLNLQLANVRPGDVTSNNRLVGLINASVAQINLKRGQLETGKKYIEGLRAKASEAREEFVKYVLDSRTLAEEVEAKRIAAAANDDVESAIKVLNADGGKYSLAEPSRSFRAQLKKLTDLESRVLSEDIPLRRESGGTSRVAVAVNGEKAVEMVLDSGASLICLPQKLALELNVKPGPKDPPIVLTLADGREITGTFVKLKTVRIGQFEVEDVDCAILGPEATNAEPLLGMSYLKEFEFQINSARETLTLTRIKDNSRSSRSRRSR